MKIEVTGASYELGSSGRKQKQLKGQVKEKWGKLTDDDLDVVDGKRDQLLGKIQERYGITKEEVETEFKKHWK